MCLTCWVSTCWTPKWKTTLLLFCHDWPTCRDHNTPSCWEETKTAFEIFLLAWVTQTNLISKYSPSTTLYYKVLVQYYSVLQSTSPVLLCTTKYYSSTTLYYTVLLQYYSVLQSTTPVLLCTTKYYSTTTLYYTVLLQYYSVLQTTTPVLLCTTKYYSSTTLYYSSTTLYYKVLRQYYSVLQSTTPVLLCTTQYYSSTTPVLLCTTQYYSSTTPVLLCTTKYYSSTSLYYKVLLQYYSVLHSTTPVLLCTTPVLLCTTQYYSSTTLYYKVLLQYNSSTTLYYSWLIRGAAEMSLQHHQILRLPRKVTLIIDPLHTWNVISNKRSNKSQPPTSANTAPATQNDTHNQSSSHMKRYLQCAEQQVSLSKLTKYCACHEKWISWLILVTYETLFTMRGDTSVIVQTHQILRLPRKMTCMINPRHTWNAIYNARSNKRHCPNSSNTAPATQNETHDWSAWHMKRYLQCAEQQASLSKLIKYCACHAKWFSKISETFLQNRWNVNYNARPIRDRSEHDPRMIRERSEHETVTPQPASQPRLLFTPTTSILYWKIQHFALQLSFQISPNTAPATKSDTSTSPNTAPATQNDSHHWSSWHVTRHLQCAAQQHSPSDLTKYCAGHAKWNSWLISMTYETLFTMRGTTGGILQHHQILRLPRKMTVMTDPRHIWNAIYNARNNRWHPPTSPNTAPATQNDCHDWSSSHMKRYLQCAEQQVASSNITKYCACHAKWLSWLILVTYETLFTMRGTTGGILQHHQILRLPRKMILQNFTNISPKQMKRQLQCATDPSWIRPWSELDPSRKPSSATRLATEVTFQDHHDLFVLKNTTFRAPANIPNFTECCACHEKWHFNFTEYCACHAKWLASLILMTCHTSFTMRSATALTLRPH